MLKAAKAQGADAAAVDNVIARAQWFYYTRYVLLRYLAPVPPCLLRVSAIQRP